jgi:hypothetical protein
LSFVPVAAVKGEVGEFSEDVLFSRFVAFEGEAAFERFLSFFELIGGDEEGFTASEVREWVIGGEVNGFIVGIDGFLGSAFGFEEVTEDDPEVCVSGGAFGLGAIFGDEAVEAIAAPGHLDDLSEGEPLDGGAFKDLLVSAEDLAIASVAALDAPVILSDGSVGRRDGVGGETDEESGQRAGEAMGS